MPLPEDPDADPILAAGWPRFDQELRRVIGRAWPEIFGPKHPIFRITQMERRAWRNLIDFNKLEAPWVVWGCPPTTSEPGWGACNVVYRPRVTVYYISSSPAPGVTDIATYVQNKIAALEAVLQSQDFTGFQYWPGETTYDVSENNPANAVFLGSNIPMFAGSLTFRAHFGYIAKREPFPESPETP